MAGVAWLMACGSSGTGGDAPSPGPSTPLVDASPEASASDGDAAVIVDAGALVDACAHETCEQFTSVNLPDGLRQLCGLKPDLCGGQPISCYSMCAYGTCTDTYLDAGVCSCERYAGADPQCPGTKAVRCRAASAVTAGCVAMGIDGLFCCP